MYKAQEQVRDFHKRFGCTINEVPTIPALTDAILRTDLIQEELDEFAKAYLQGNLTEVADALGDILYVVLGSAVTFGIDLEPIFEEIHKSNLSKVWEDGEVHRREDGKILKPPTFKKPDIKPLLEGQATGIGL